MRVRDLMTTNAVTIEASESCHAAVEPMASTKTARGPEIDGGFFRSGQQGFRGGRR